MNIASVQDMQDTVVKFQREFGRDVVITEKECVRCHKKKLLRTFYRTQNPLMPNYYTSVCKVCIDEVLDFHNIFEAKAILSYLCYPFIEKIWYDISKDKRTVSVLGMYLTRLQASEHSTSVFTPLDESRAEFDTDPYQLKVQQLNQEEKSYLKAKWGNHYNFTECLKLEEYYNEMFEDYHITTRSHKDYLKKIVKTSLMMDNMIEQGNINGFKQISATYDALMKSANFAQVKAQDKKHGDDFNAFSLLFEKAEKEGFIPVYHTEKDMDVVDKTIKNLKQWTNKLVKGDIDMESLMENAAQRVLEQAEEEKKINTDLSTDDYEGIGGLEDD